jgi:uncharacterized protein (DUF58 family)
MAVLWGAFGLYALRQGFADDRSPLVIVGATAFAVMVVGVVWPIIAMRRVSVSTHTPNDATVGQRTLVELDVHSRARDVRVRLLDPPTPWVRVDRNAKGTIVQRPPHRGVYRRVRIELKTSAPLGVFTRRRVLNVALPGPLYVAPRAIAAPTERVTASAIAHGSVVSRSPYTAVDAVRSVRPFVSGDPARHIHWPSSARRGELVVRDFDPPAVLGLAIVVDLRGGEPGAIEAAASRARGLAEAVLAEGAACCLLTFDGRPTTTFVTAPREVGRALAAAVPGAPPEPPAGWPVEVVRP